VVLEQFGQKNEVLDDELPTDIRSIFYTLEAKRILTFRRIEYEGEDGMTLRGFFWRFHVDRIERDLNASDAAQEDLNVYEELPKSCWQRQAA
ncbi:MAG: hypothetical protein R3185_05885, partial [Candidatus Thermoplasmatota archaeon]|nr:hypothetical protein [Candidatus Thermoplasmatota archaeon]